MLDRPYNRAEIAICLAEQYNLIDRTNEALEFINQALQNIALISKSEQFNACILLCETAEQFAKAGFQERCLHLLSEALQQVKAFEDDDDRDYGLIHVAEVYAELGLYDRAIQIGLMVRDEFRAIFHLFEPIIYMCVDRCHHKAISQLISAIEYEGYKDMLLENAAKSYLVNDRIDRALDLLSTISSANIKATVLAAAAQKYREIEQPEQSLTLLTQAENEALQEEDTGMKAQSLRIIAEQYAEVGECDRARRILTQAEQFASSMPTVNLLEQIPRNEILSGIARAFSKVEQYENSLRTADAMTDNIRKASTVADMAQESSERVLKERALNDLTAAEQAILEEDSHLADLQRVQLAEEWAKLGEIERAQAIAENIGDVMLKKLALRYAGVDTEEDLHDISSRLSKDCAIASEQSNYNEGLRLLKQVLTSTNLLTEEDYKTSLFKEIIKAYFCLLKSSSR
ncbi:MAG: hypothetical protein ACRC2R_08285 [Xenococcaceae cyanobacterium]